MNDIEGLRDGLIADEILRIQTMSHGQTVQELIAFHSAQMEAMGLDELLDVCQRKNGTRNGKTE